MGPAIAEVMAAVSAQGLAPAGPVFSHHFRLEAAHFDFEVGVPVSGPVDPAGRVRAGMLPAARVARTVYHGDYAGLGAAWGEFQAWLNAEGLDLAPNFWETYETGPESSANPADWRTGLHWVVRG
jgi:effector-binding domain-containing protein